MNINYLVFMLFQKELGFNRHTKKHPTLPEDLKLSLVLNMICAFCSVFNGCALSTRITKAANAFTLRAKINLKTKKRVYRATVILTLLYAFER